MAPKIIVILRMYLSGKRLNKSCLNAKHHQQIWKKQNGIKIPISLLWLTKILSCHGAFGSNLAKASFCWFVNFCPKKIE